MTSTMTSPRDDTLGPPPGCQLVVSRYAEDVAWVRPACEAGWDVVVYNKGDGSLMDTGSAKVERRPNRGREGETWLHHIAQAYEALPAVTLFVQGRPYDHLGLADGDVQGLLAALRNAATQADARGTVVPIGTVTDEPDGRFGMVQVAPYFSAMFGGPAPKVWQYVRGAQYAVPRATLQARPRAFYEHWAHQAAASKAPTLHSCRFYDPEAIDPWTLEHLWPYMFCHPLPLAAVVAAADAAASPAQQSQTRGVPSAELLARFPEDEMLIGPIQRSEALMLFGLIRVLRPYTIAEIGFFRGDSCAVLCEACDDHCGRVISYDIAVDEVAARALTARFPNLEVRTADQRTVGAGNVPVFADGAPIDFLFIDASHDLDTNQQTWRALHNQLSPNAVVMVHDTGMWVDGVTPERFTKWGVAGTTHGVTGRYHQPHEVMFVHWLVETFPDWVKMDFMSVHAFRHGFTLLQRKRVDTMTWGQ